MDSKELHLETLYLDTHGGILSFDIHMGVRAFTAIGVSQFGLRDDELFKIHEWLKSYFASKSAQILGSDTPNHSGDL